MREIKIRVWNGKKFLDSAEILILIDEVADLNEYEGLSLTFDFFNNNKEIIPMQYTGIKNNDGKEIYEGDIVCYESGIKGEVKFSTEENPLGWYIDLINGQKVGLYTNMKLLGNIYQNPDLLK